MHLPVEVDAATVDQQVRRENTYLCVARRRLKPDELFNERKQTLCPKRLARDAQALVGRHILYQRVYIFVQEDRRQIASHPLPHERDDFHPGAIAEMKVRHEQIEVRILREPEQSVRARFDGNYLVSRRPEQHARRFAHAGVMLDEQDANRDHRLPVSIWDSPTTIMSGADSSALSKRSVGNMRLSELTRESSVPGKAQV